MRRSDRTSGTCGSSRSPDRVQGPSSVPSWDLTSLSIGQPSPHDDRAAHRRAVHRAIVLIGARRRERDGVRLAVAAHDRAARERGRRSEEHTSELQSLAYLVCRLLLEKKKKNENTST